MGERRSGNNLQSERRGKGRGDRSGRPKEYDATEDDRLARNWQSAKSRGTYKAEFARNNGMKLADFNRLLARVRDRKHHAK